ncbi:hypothetical protein D3C87_1519600 [compost metagenome]
MAGGIRKNLRHEARDDIRKFLLVLAGLHPMHHLQHQVLHALILAAFGVEALPFQTIVAENLDGVVHFADLIPPSVVQNLDIVILACQPGDDVAHPDQRQRHAPAQDKIKHRQKHQGRQNQHGFRDVAEEVASGLGRIDRDLRTCRNAGSHRFDLLQKLGVQAIMLVTK